MRCPFCAHNDTSVKDSRTTDDQAAIRRRRICSACGSRFTTFERIQLRELTVVKKNGHHVPFDREKLARSVTSAMQKQSLDPNKIDRIITSVIRQFETSGENDISTHIIGEMVMQSLFNIDPVAYVRFASIYKDFANVQDFIDCISSIEKQSKEHGFDLLKNTHSHTHMDS
ncbi:MAG: transcriptional regulator NrdR [Candidatus Paracaedibacteraceae bacterium]|nr:transcriptional regulator NrdR [Candidatus Paracaedibacteraceae bacterium]